MKDKINIAELLKDCPKGMELDCLMYECIVFDCIADEDILPIRCCIRNPKGGYNICHFTEYGCWSNIDSSKCVIFPKGKTTWEGFVPPNPEFKCGDVLACDCSNGDSQLFIFKEYDDDNNTVCFLFLDTDGTLDIDEFAWKIDRLATEEEKQKLFNAIKANGYKWNEATKTLEKLVTIFKVGDKIKLKNEYAKKYDDFNTQEITEIRHSHYILDDEKAMSFSNQYLYELVTVEPKFKVGDRVRNKNYKDYIYDIHDITDKGYRAKEVNADSPIIILFGSQEDNYELAPNKFDINTLKPFDKVVVRDSDKEMWRASMFSHTWKDKFFCIGVWYNQCIPYEANKDLIGTTNDCEEYYKIW